MAREPDGTLNDWDDIADEEDWQVLLLGNGLSMNVWPPFGYRSLAKQAARGGLTTKDRALFGKRTNFERVLADLSVAIRVARTVGMDTDPMYRRYRSIQKALGSAVKEVHLNKSRVPDDALATIRDAMESFEWVFTTSYDLLIYWAMGHPDRDYTPFKDHFRYGGRCEFDPDRASVQLDDVPVYYLHGALHLVTGSGGKTWKLRADGLSTILDQFGQPIDGDAEARPLLVTEGSSVEKLKSIEGNVYLSHALERLYEVDVPVVVFGSRLGRQDDHLVEALSENSRRPVAVSMRPDKTKAERAALQLALWKRLRASRVYFYDATTHPLGSKDLRAN